MIHVQWGELIAKTAAGVIIAIFAVQILALIVGMIYVALR